MVFKYIMKKLTVKRSEVDIPLHTADMVPKQNKNAN